MGSTYKVRRDLQERDHEGFQRGDGTRGGLYNMGRTWPLGMQGAGSRGRGPGEAEEQQAEGTERVPGGFTGEWFMTRGSKLPVIKETNPEHVMYSVVTTVNNAKLYIGKLLRE